MNKEFIETFDLEPKKLAPSTDTTTKKKIVEQQNTEEEIVGPDPRKKPKLSEQDLYLSNFPSAEMYERSYNHRDTVTGIISSTLIDYIITLSNDGHVKFWKKAFHLIEFLKHFRAHAGPITGYSLSANHQRLATVSPADRFLKIFEVLNFDMITMKKLDFVPHACEYIEISSLRLSCIAVSCQDTGDIYLIEEEEKSEDDDFDELAPLGANHEEKKKINYKVFRKISFHSKPVKFIKFNTVYNVAISIDSDGMIEYWDPFTGDFPKDAGLKFQRKISTDLYELAKNKTSAWSLNFTHNQQLFAIMGRDRYLRIFDFATGKMVRKFDETYKHMQEVQNENSATAEMLKLDKLEFDKRIAIEKEIEKAPENLSQMSVDFDESDTIMVYPCVQGIKVVSLKTYAVLKLFGKHENNERFLKVALYQGKEMKNTMGTSMFGGTAAQQKETDPSIFCTAFKKNRFYIFTRREPPESDEKVSTATGRDVFVERPTKEDQQVVTVQPSKNLPTQATIQTTKGDIVVKLFPDECPKTVENFVVHSKNGYYNGCIFHRIIKSFMIQTGDPEGDGTGGESIWGHEFEDEFHPRLKHDRPFTLSMANAGPNTNGSQFFITTVPCPWLDGKHTVFGRVIKGSDVVTEIEKIPTDKLDKPTIDVKIITIKIN